MTSKGTREFSFASTRECPNNVCGSIVFLTAGSREGFSYLSKVLVSFPTQKYVLAFVIYFHRCWAAGSREGVSYLLLKVLVSGPT